ncbi:FAD/NAD(P)-binding domain-containing protein [Agrocybe pediades]|nr:FAD/NAD(P)-binding domain-containing protein [Agrocybe pediades]
MSESSRTDAKSTRNKVLSSPIAILGAGMAGLITAHVLHQDGFTDITVITRDPTVGGTWARNRIYPGLHINTIHNVYRFSALEMPHPKDSSESGGHITGEGLCEYMEKFYETFLKGKVGFKFEEEIIRVRRDDSDPGGVWEVTTRRSVGDGDEVKRRFSRVVLATGVGVSSLNLSSMALIQRRFVKGCSTPSIPQILSSQSAEKKGYKGLILHSLEFAERMDNILHRVPPTPAPKDDGTTGGGRNSTGGGNIVVIGGGRSGKDICAKVANEGRRVTHEEQTLKHTQPTRLSEYKTRTISAYHNPRWDPRPVYIQSPTRILPPVPYLYKSHFNSNSNSNANANSDFKRKLKKQFASYSIPTTSPLRTCSTSILWDVRTSDEGCVRAGSYYDLVQRGLVQVEAPRRGVEYYCSAASSSSGGSREGGNGEGVELKLEGGVVLDDGRHVQADVVVLATGYKSSWEGIFDDAMLRELGMHEHPIPSSSRHPTWEYTSLSHPPEGVQVDAAAQVVSHFIYRGIVPARNIARRDFAIVGAMFVSNLSYTTEVAAHWVSSYFQSDRMRLPAEAEEAEREAEVRAQWKKRRYPGTKVNESYGAVVDLWTWPQIADELLEDMYLPSMRSGGNWLTWPFKTIKPEELCTLGEERRALREREGARG